MSGQGQNSGGKLPAPVPGPTAGTPGGDPAMEDILASIRRILNEDDALPAKPAEAAPEPLTLTEEMLVTPTPAAVQPTAYAPPPEPEDTQPMAASDHDEYHAHAAAQATGAPGGLIAPEAAAATSAAVGHLLRAVAQERTATISRGGVSLEDVVREEIRPLLKEWLDQHLPPLVERLVRIEIERVVGRALG